jgi:hypothetical protein
MAAPVSDIMQFMTDDFLYSTFNELFFFFVYSVVVFLDIRFVVLCILCLLCFVGCICCALYIVFC